MNKLSHTIILEESIFDFRYVRHYDIDIPKEKKVELFANNGDHRCSAASDLGLHSLPVTHLGVSSLQTVKKGSFSIAEAHLFLGLCLCTINVLKLRTLYSILFLPKFFFQKQLFLKTLSGMAKKKDPD